MSHRQVAAYRRGHGVACRFFLCASLMIAPSVWADDAAPSTQRASGPVTSDVQALAGLNLDAPGLEQVKAVAAQQDMAAVKAAYLEYRRSKSPARWTFMPSDMPATAAAETDPEGEEICNHVIRRGFYVLEPRMADMGRDFNWLYNPIPKNSPEYTDEWTWCVISRMHFWEGLAKAYWKTHNEKYAREWVAQLFDFAAKNPLELKWKGNGPSLWRTLDAAGRMGGTWPNAYYRFLNSPAFTPDAQWVYLRLMYDHADLLMNGLADSKRTGNWVVAECSALFTIAVLNPEIGQSAMWRETAIKRLIKELERMVPPDGYEAELTPTYHYFSLSSYVAPVKLARLNGITLPPEFRSKILAMYQAPIMVMDQAGNLVPTNDSHPMNAAREAKNGLALLGDDPLLQWAASGGKQGTGLPDSTMLPYAGFYAMRSGWKPDDTFLFFRGGPAGIGHEHEDMLQITLRARGKPLLIDPGTYNYDHSDSRRYVISTPSHNTIIVDGKYQHRGPNSAPVTEAVNNPWITTPLFDFVSATYDRGYQRNEYDTNRQYTPQKWVGELDRSVSHTRRVLYLKPDVVLLLDTLDGTGEHTFDAHFHLDAPAAELDAKTQAAFSQNKGEVQLALYPLDRTNLTTDIVQGQNEPMLGWYPLQHRAIPTVRFRKTQAAPAVFATLLVPYSGHLPEINTEPMKLNNAQLWGQQIQVGDELMQIALSKDNSAQEIDVDLAAYSIRSHASALIVRQQNQITCGGWNLTRYRSPEAEFTASKPATLLWRINDANQLEFYNAGGEAVTIQISKPKAAQMSLPIGAWTAVP